MALILFVEHHSAFRQAASYVIDQEPDLEVVAQGGSVVEGRQRMAQGGPYKLMVEAAPPSKGARGPRRTEKSVPSAYGRHSKGSRGRPRAPY